MTEIAPRPIALPPELEPPPTHPYPVAPVLGICTCGEPVTRETLGFAEGKRVTCRACVPAVTGNPVG